jgi:hypothetical protein
LATSIGVWKGLAATSATLCFKALQDRLVLQVFKGALVDRWWEAGEGNGQAWDAGWFRAEVTDVVDDLKDYPGLYAELR